jgi:hypothetical protein
MSKRNCVIDNVPCSLNVRFTPGKQTSELGLVTFGATAPAPSPRWPREIDLTMKRREAQA